MSGIHPGKKDRIARWESLRAGGRRRYILVHGVLGFALPVSVISSLIKFWGGTPGPFWGTLAISLLLVPFSGYAFGAIMWRINERAYQHRRRDGSRAG